MDGLEASLLGNPGRDLCRREKWVLTAPCYSDLHEASPATSQLLEVPEVRRLLGVETPHQIGSTIWQICDVTTDDLAAWRAKKEGWKVLHATNLLKIEASLHVGMHVAVDGGNLKGC